MAETGATVTQTGAFERNALKFLDLGYEVFPLPHKKKSPPPEGTTGHNGFAWSRYQVEEFLAEEGGPHNIGIRISGDLLGLDVDDYETPDGKVKSGGETLSRLEVELGFLPDTVVLTARRDRVSGIRLYRVPAGLRWLNQPSIETLWRGHRYAVAPGSLHPDLGVPYLALDSATWEDSELPRREDLPELPDEWVRYLSGGEVDTMPSAATDELVGEFLDRWDLGEGPDGNLGFWRRQYRESVDVGVARHDAMRRALTGAMIDARYGVVSAREAHDTMEELFLGDVAGDRGALVAQGEFDRMVRHSVGMAIAAPAQDFAVEAGELEVFDLFAKTPILGQLRDFAYARKASPYLLLALVIGRVLAEIPPHVRLPGKSFGSTAALNLCVAAVGPPGSGKSAAFELSEEFLFGLDGSPSQTHEVPLGTSQGMAAEFVRWDGERGKYVVKSDPRCIFTVDEISTFKASASADGGIAGTLRSMVTGQTLGARNATAENNRIVPKKSYRAVVFFGVQPTAADALLSEEEIGLGTPQRFIWELAEDSTIPRYAAPVEPLGWELPDNLPGEIDYPEEIAEEIAEWHWRKATGSVPDPLDGHLFLTRLKVATALSVLHGETRITPEFWDLSGKVIQRSTEAQRHCGAAMSKAAVKRRMGKAESEGKAKVVEARTIASETERWERVEQFVVEHLREAGGEGLRKADLRRSINSRQRDLLDPVLSQLVGRGTVRARKTNESGAGRTGEKFTLN